MSLLVVQAPIKPEAIEEVEAAAREMFAAVERAAPEGVRYSSCRLADGETFLVLLHLEDGDANPLAEIPEFRSFQARLPGWTARPPSAGPAEVIGSYKLF